MSGEGVTNEYYQHAQIIQGALIFLSACVAVVGHIVQSNLRAKERKELRCAQRIGGGEGTPSQNQSAVNPTSSATRVEVVEVRKMVIEDLLEMGGVTI